MGFPGGSVVKNPPANAGDAGLILGSGRPPGEGDSHEPCHAGPPKEDRSRWRALTKHGPLEEGMANHSIIPALRTLWTL